MLHTPQGKAMSDKIDELENEEQTAIGKILSGADKIKLADPTPRPKLPQIRDHLTHSYSEKIRTAQAKLDQAIGAAIDEFVSEKAEAAMALELAMAQRDREYVEGRKEDQS